MTPADGDSIFDRLDRAGATSVPAMLAALATDLAAAGRWHAVFDVRLLEARVALGLPITGDLGRVDAATREKLDERSLAACREVGWPLLDAGQPAAAWMYLRAAAEPAEVVSRLERLLEREDLADNETLRQEIMELSLWEGLDPALGLALMLVSHGTCNAITAYMQAVARLPAPRRRPAADVLVDHLHAECIEAGRPVDLSHLHNVLEIGRECTDPTRIAKALALAKYAGGQPEDLLMPGDPPFERLAVASQWFFAAQLGDDQDEAVEYFMARADESPDDPACVEWLAILLSRIGRPKDALHRLLARELRPRDQLPQDRGASATGLLPSLVDLAVAADDLPALLDVCRRRDDPVTFAAALAAHHHFHQR